MKAEPRAPTTTRRGKSIADRLEVIGVPGEGKPLPPGLVIEDWRKERDAGGSPQNPNPPKLFTGRLKRLKPRGFVSKAQWRKFFADPALRRFADEKAHATKGGAKVRYRRLPERKGGPDAGAAR